MNRRDVITLLIIIIWGLYAYFILPITTKPELLIGYFTLSGFVVCLLFIILFILSLSIRKFGKWGDKEIFKRNKNDDRKRV
jgi:hypothetical protein